MATINSVPTYMRKLLNSKGKTEHNGRGAFWMSFDVSFEEVKKRIESKQDKLKDLLDSCEIEENEITLVFKKDCVKCKYYRSFHCKTSKQFGDCFGVYMV